MKKYNIAILRPSGNDTALVKGIVAKKKRKEINDEIMRQYPNVEQVGFYEFDKNSKSGRLEMAGGEFCGNATRALAYLLLAGKKGKISIKVSGAKQYLEAGIRRKLTAYAQMPIKRSFSNVGTVSKNLWLVELEGISHLVTLLTKPYSQPALKRKAKRLLQENNLFSTLPAAGVMFIKGYETKDTAIEPIVWVRYIETFFYETACASGTCAIGLWYAKQVKKQKSTIIVKQPSGMSMRVRIEKTSKSFKSAYIDGPIKILWKGELSL